MDIDKIKKLKGTSRSDSDIKYLRNAITELAFAISEGANDKQRHHLQVFWEIMDGK